MKRLFRFACTVFAAAVLSMGFTAAAANDIVDTSNTSHGYVTVNYTSSAKLKVGIQYNGGTTVYRDCPSGKDASFSLDQGDGKYTVTLYRNVPVFLRGSFLQDHERYRQGPLRSLPHLHLGHSVLQGRRCFRQGC